ncbi:hypothetical protein [Jiella marina]|uniref:hypothetical protein n=1 Tax=Jiella sp. LLJ827 TaxID=2917712 RepID=UPI002101A244|nr:hypothetical protein [Jiella sp. LLJ827]MCQ0986673.1 hypothetical protein [Jiella sp. LLJ827]
MSEPQPADADFAATIDIRRSGSVSGLSSGIVLIDQGKRKAMRRSAIGCLEVAGAGGEAVAIERISPRPIELQGWSYQRAG